MLCEKNQFTLLLIECDANMGWIFQKYFESSNFSIDLAYNSKEGIAKALTNKYDLVIIDLENPRKECFDVLTRIREVNESISIVILGNKDTIGNEINTYRKGGNIYHPKPINFELLIEEIRQLLRNKKKKILLEMLDLEIDINKRIVRRANKEINLTRNEFNTLLLITKGEGEVITRQKIVSCLLNYNKDIQYGAVDTMISRLRTKLSVYGERTVIDTVIKSGYRLNQRYSKNYHTTFYK